MSGHGTLHVLRNKNFARLFAAGATSIAGFSIGQVALTIVVYNNTGGSALDISYIGVSFTVASVLFSLLAGVMVDRYERRILMVISDLIRATSLVVLIVYLIVSGFSLAVVLGVAFVLGSFTTLFQPAERALTPSVVGQEEIANANALVQTSNSMLQFSASAVGGVIAVVAGVLVAFGLNAATFLVSATLIAGVGGFAKKGAQAQDESQRRSMLQDLREGFSYIASNRGLLWLTISAGAGNFFLSMALQFFINYAEGPLHGNGATYGVITGLFALGWAPGAYASTRLRTARYAGLTWIVVGIFVGGCLAGMYLLPYLVPVLILAFGAGTGLGMGVTTWLTAVQLIVPTEMQGRYFGLDQLGSFAVIPLGQLLGGVLITATSVNFDYLVAGVGTAASAGVFLLSPSLRNLGWKQEIKRQVEA